MQAPLGSILCPPGDAVMSLTGLQRLDTAKLVKVMFDDDVAFLAPAEPSDRE